MNSILSNAIISIQLGVDDYQLSKDNPNRVVSAIRNIYSGVLLLFKEKLRQMSPNDSDEILLKRNIEFKPDREGVKIIGKGRVTVGYEEIKERFKQLGINVDWKRLDKVNELRNEIEHYRTHRSVDEVKEVIWNLFPVIRDFIREYLNYEPVELLGEPTWKILLEVEEIYSKERYICEKEIEKFIEKSLLRRIITDEGRCIKCYSNLIHP